MHDAFGHRGRDTQAVEIVEAAAHHFRAERGDLRGSLIVASEAEHMMTGVDEFRDARGSDPTRRASDKYSHGMLR